MKMNITNRPEYENIKTKVSIPHSLQVGKKRENKYPDLPPPLE